MLLIIIYNTNIHYKQWHILTNFLGGVHYFQYYTVNTNKNIVPFKLKNIILVKHQYVSNILHK